jgi:hypothetical protein
MIDVGPKAEALEGAHGPLRGPRPLNGLEAHVRDPRTKYIVAKYYILSEVRLH